MRFKEFVKESLAIERIFRDPTEEELEATKLFLNKTKIEIVDLVELVAVYQPDAKLRNNKIDRVWIGGREAPEGGLPLLGELGNLLYQVSSPTVNKWNSNPWLTHAEYELLHPFTDGNGRSGRALWAWLMRRHGYKFEYLFLQMYYYQTLSEYSNR